MNRQEKTALVEKFLRADLAPYCGENFAIHQVVQEDCIIYQEEYWEPGHTPPLHFTLVYEGRRRQIPIEWKIGMSRRIWPKLLAAGVEGMPLFDFAEKSWWLKHYRQRPASKFLFPDAPTTPPATEAQAMNRQEKTALVEKLLREDLAPYCGENFAIHQVVQEDYFRKEEYWEPGHAPPPRFTIVYEGEREQIPVEWRLGMSHRIWPKLLAEGIEGLPLFDFAEKSRWLKRHRQRQA